MGHHISALLVRGQFDHGIAAQFDLHVIALEYDIAMVPLVDWHLDHWAEKLDALGFVADQPAYNARVVHVFAEQLRTTGRFAGVYALIETSYVGGLGDQAAAVYRDGTPIMQPIRARRGPINDALGHLGIGSRLAWIAGDAFERVGLAEHRAFHDIEDEYGRRYDPDWEA